jgi:alpha 1,2-mannosyltransferase
MILWPDFWYTSESPHYFQIAQIPEPPLHKRASTESGEILYSKATHGPSLMLAAYYNYYGPQYYYLLHSQGAPGEGDKETFPWAATALNETFYNVKKGVDAIGHFTSKGDFQGSAMVQYNPVQDFHVSRYHSGSLGESSDVGPMFVHANFPKFNPASIFKGAAMGASGPTRDGNGSFHRVWHDEIEGIDFFGFDLE